MNVGCLYLYCYCIQYGVYICGALKCCAVSRESKQQRLTWSSPGILVVLLYLGIPQTGTGSCWALPPYVSHFQLRQKVREDRHATMEAGLLNPMVRPMCANISCDQRFGKSTEATVVQIVVAQTQERLKFVESLVGDNAVTGRMNLVLCCCIRLSILDHRRTIEVFQRFAGRPNYRFLLHITGSLNIWSTPALHRRTSTIRDWRRICESVGQTAEELCHGLVLAECLGISSPFHWFKTSVTYH